MLRSQLVKTKSLYGLNTTFKEVNMSDWLLAILYILGVFGFGILAAWLFGGVRKDEGDKDVHVNNQHGEDF